MPKISRKAKLFKELEAVAASRVRKAHLRLCFDEEDSFEDDLDYLVLVRLAKLESSLRREKLREKSKDELKKKDSANQNKVNVYGTEASSNRGTDASSNGGTDASSNGGTDASSNGGTEASSNGGTDASSNGGTEASSNRGTEVSSNGQTKNDKIIGKIVQFVAKESAPHAVAKREKCSICGLGAGATHTSS